MSVNQLVTNVRRALRQQLLTVSGLPAAPNQQWEGTTFTPASGTPWIRETMLRQPGAPPEPTVGPQALVRHGGGYQVSLFFPPDDPADVNPIESLGEAIRAAFPSSLELTYNSQLVRSLGCGLGTIAPTTMAGFAWLHLPCRITWTADTYNES